jgi:hypothetical protein
VNVTLKDPNDHNRNDHCTKLNKRFSRLRKVFKFSVARIHISTADHFEHLRSPTNSQHTLIMSLSRANLQEREDIMKELRRDVGVVRFTGSLSFAAVSDKEGKVTIPLNCLHGKWHCRLAGLDIIKCEEGNPYTVLVEIGGEINNLIVLKDGGRGSIKENTEFHLEGSELTFLLLEGTRERKPLPRVTLYGDIHLDRVDQV